MQLSLRVGHESFPASFLSSVNSLYSSWQVAYAGGFRPPGALTQLGARVAPPPLLVSGACFPRGQGCLWFPVFCLNRIGWDGSCFHLSPESPGAPSCRPGEVHSVVEAQGWVAGVFSGFSGPVPPLLLLPFTARLPGEPACLRLLAENHRLLGRPPQLCPGAPSLRAAYLWVSVTRATSGSLSSPHLCFWTTRDLHRGRAASFR